jgi:hypothetical protein|tara:strand:- start:932 stop:1165 length:234 start_codon:yes stop_codon:yes gene_type:complete
MSPSVAIHKHHAFSINAREIAAAFVTLYHLMVDGMFPLWHCIHNSRQHTGWTTRQLNNDAYRLRLLQRDDRHRALVT